MDYSNLRQILLNNQESLSKRFRALFTLKNWATTEAVDIIAQAFEGEDSVLLKHELAFVLGQTGNRAAVPCLLKVLQDTRENAMVRHEAAEALGALGDEIALPILEQYLQDPEVVVRETCQLAIKNLKADKNSDSPYKSVDPAPATNSFRSLSEEALGDILMNPSLSLFERYGAMFALRNKGGVAAVQQLARGFEEPHSALFRHEVAYVFGQMQDPASIPCLTKQLEKQSEEAMVRHECAEALGSIATDECLPTLRKYAEDPERVVRESCQIALDMWQHEQSGAFQYALV